MALTADERETVIVWTDSCDMIEIHTSQRKIVTQLLANPQAQIIEDHMYEGTRALVAKIPLGGITIRKAAKGTIRRINKATTKRGAPTGAKCGTIKSDGQPCGAVASKATGSCSKHPAKV